MSTYFSNLNNQGDVTQTQYLLDSKLTRYQSSHLPHNMMYMNPSSAAGSHPEFFPAVSSMPEHSYVEAQSVDSREEMLFMAPSGHPMIMQPMDRQQFDVAASYSDRNAAALVDQQLHIQNSDLNLQHQELSLSLGNQMLSYHNPYTNSAVSSLMNNQIEHADEHGSQSGELKKAEYFSFDLAGRSNNGVKIGSLYNPQPSMSPKGTNYDSKLHEGTFVGGMIYNSKYLKAVQELLDEVVNLHQDLKKIEKRHAFQSFGPGTSEETKLKSSDPQKSDDLSPAERNDLQNKMTILLSMSDEVDKRYMQYYQQMQIVASSFEMVAGSGAARRYTALALRTISRQFRCLRDAIKKQIQVVQQNLGVQDSQGVGFSRLRLVDQQLRQQRNLQQFGVLRQPWRPQRGLPETAVSILRAWLFEHFLHPYPKDSEKIMLARQTGLSRGQVANWFINARVRLWKPMIEEMYKEEFGGIEGDYSKSSELGLKSESEGAGEELHESSISPAANGTQLRKSNDLRTDVNSNLEMNAYKTKMSFQDGSYESNQADDRSPVKPYDFSMLGGTAGTQASIISFSFAAF